MNVYEQRKPVKDRNPWLAMWRGARLRCPKCGKGKLFHRYLKVSDACPDCGEELHHHRADDAPAYLTIFLVGHILVPPIMLIERFYEPNLWLQFAVWSPILVLLTLWLLPRVKGAVVGLQWANRMHGFESAPTAQKALDSST